MSKKQVAQKTTPSELGEDRLPVKLSPLVHALAKQIANVTREEIGDVIERHAIDGLVAENDRVQAAIRARVPARRG